MSKAFYSVEEAAEALAVHSRTILRWIKQGELKAFKAGRQWRIKPEDLQEFTGDREAARPATASAVLDIPVSGESEADRLQTLILASLSGRQGRGDDADVRVNCLYNSADKSLRVVLWGGVTFMKDFFALVDMYGN